MSNDELAATRVVSRPVACGRSLLRAATARARSLFADRKGATALEYGLITGGISVAIIVVVFAIGAEVNGFLEQIGDMLRANFPGT
jgi:Flp pilus assembly pilin Flp